MTNKIAYVDERLRDSCRIAPALTVQKDFFLGLSKPCCCTADPRLLSECDSIITHQSFLVLYVLWYPGSSVVTCFGYLVV